MATIDTYFSDSKNKEPAETPTEQSLRALKHKNLKDLCRASGYKVSGNKSVLIRRILHPTDADRTRKPKPRRKKQKRQTAKGLFVSRMLSDICKRSALIEVSRNQFGKYEHTPTGLVFDEISRKVIGRQLPTGQIGSLRTQDLEQCLELQFNYILPETIES